MKSVLRILNLEDNEEDAVLNREMLSARWPDCEFTRVGEGAGFVAALERDDFDLILSDYTLPGFNGMEALALARKKRPEIPFLFVSGTIGEDTAIEALKNGALDYVLKHRLMRLIPAVDRALRETAEHAECDRAEEAMRQSEHKYRALFECLGDAAFLADEESEKIIDTNHRAETLLGCTRAQILGFKQPQFLVLEHDCPSNGASGAGDTVADFDSELIRLDGSTVPVEVHASRLTLYDHAMIFRLCHEVPGRRRQ